MLFYKKRYFSSIQNLFKDRNLIFQSSNQDFIQKQFIELKSQNLSVYSGFDPTSDSLHLGNFLPIINLIRLSTMGFKPIFLIGGATGQIGDPSGKQQERNLIESKTLQQNQEKIEQVLTSVIKSVHSYIQKNKQMLLINEINTDFQLINNKEFYNMNILDFMKDIGRYFRVSNLIGKESVQSRLNSDKGISFTEFSYQIFQAHDFYCLNQQNNCILQIGGSDQWGNMTQGCDYIRKITKREVYCLTLPLLVNSQGIKFGKSENNAIWLDKDPFQMQQYLLNLPDSDIEKYMQMLTLIPLDIINQKMDEHKKNPEEKIAQKYFAQQMLEMLFGKNDQFTKLFFETDFRIMFSLSEQDIESFFQNLNTYPQKKQIDRKISHNLLEMLFQIGAGKSKSEIRKNVDDGAVFINGTQISQQILIYQLDEKLLLNNKHLVIKVGKKKYYYAQIY